MDYQEKMAQRFMEINEMNPELESTIDLKLDFFKELQESADATIRANGGNLCTEENQWSEKQCEWIDKHGNDEEFGLVLMWACDMNGYIVYGLNPLTGVIPIKIY